MRMGGGLSRPGVTAAFIARRVPAGQAGIPAATGTESAADGACFAALRYDAPAPCRSAAPPSP